MRGDACEHVREPRLWINVIHFTRGDETVDHRRPLPAAIRPAEQPGFSAKSHTPQPTLGGIVRQAYTAIFEEQPEGSGSFENVIDRLGEIMSAGQSIQLRAQVKLKFLDQRSAFVPPNRQTFVRGFPVDRSLDLEQRIDATHDLHSDR